jgi:cell division protease FtsH
MDKLELIAHYLMKNEKIDGVNFEKLMNGELDESEFMPQEIPADEGNQTETSDGADE